MLGFPASGDPTLYSAGFHPNHRRDTARGQATLTQPHDFGEGFSASCAAIFPQSSDGLSSVRRFDLALRCHHSLVGTGDSFAMSSNEVAHRLPQIAEQMPAIGDLCGIGGSAARAIGINASSIPRDNLNPGMLLQPPCHAVRVPVGQEINHAVPLEIANDCTVACASPPRPVINANNTGGNQWLEIGCSNQPQNCVAADRHRQLVRQT